MLVVQNMEKFMFKCLLENKKIFETEAFIGRNGFTKDKIEGDGKTPIGVYKTGILFGTHEVLKENYVKIHKNLYWIDDINSKYYNQLVDITKIEMDWKSAEHLIEYPKQYEYAIELKTNPNNIPGKGSAIFLHCSVNRPTSGCIAIKKEKMKEIFELLEKDATINIGKNIEFVIK